jgi:hypothetical protein
MAAFTFQLSLVAVGDSARMKPDVYRVGLDVTFIAG